MKQLSIQTPLLIYFIVRIIIMEKDPCSEVVYLTVSCDRPYLVSLLYAILLSLHLVTYLTFFITCLI